MTLNQSHSKELIILSEHFSPSTAASAQLITQLCQALHHEGRKITVLTSTSLTTNVTHPFLVKRFSLDHTDTSTIISKVVHGFYFVLHSSFWLLLNSTNNHTVLIVSNPPFIGIIGLLLAFAKGISYNFLLQDIFPRSAVLAGILPSRGPIVFAWTRLLRLVINKSNKTIVLSDEMKKRCESEFDVKSKIEVIPNWSVVKPCFLPRSMSPYTSIWSLQNSFIVLYSGNFGRMHDMLTLLETARLLSDDPINFVFVGGGAKKNQIERYKNRLHLENVLIKPFQPLESLNESISMADVAVISLIPGSEDTVAPSKLYGILACSRPILLISSKYCELAKFIEANDIGVCIEPGDVTGLAEVLKQLSSDEERIRRMSHNANKIYQQHFSLKKATLRYSSLLG